MPHSLGRTIRRASLLGFAVLLVGAGAAAFYLWKEDRRGQQLSAEAYAAVQKGDRKGALKKFTAALACRMSARNRALAYSGRSTVYLAGRDFDHAIADLDQTLRAMPDVAEVIAARAEDYLLKGDLDRALVDYSRAIQLAPNYFRARLGRGNILLQRKQADAALADLNEAVRLEPNNVEAWQNRGNAYLLKGDLKNALPNFESVVRSLPSNQLLVRDAFNQKIREMEDRIASDLRERGVKSFDAGKFEEAIRLYDEGLSYRPSDYVASTILTNRGNACRRLGDREKAAQDYDKAIELNPEATLAYYVRATNALELGREDEALADLDEAIRQRPSYASALFIRGKFFLKRHEFAKASADFTAAMDHIEELNPAGRLQAIEKVAWMRATAAQASLRNGAEAVKLASALCAQTQWSNSKSMDTLAAAYAEAGDFEQAVKTETQALELSDMPAEARRGMEQRLGLYRQGKPFHYPEK